MAEPVNSEDTDLSVEPIKPIAINKSILPRWLILLGWAGMLIFTFHACTHMVAAGDTWVAMACGRHFINHGVDTVEPFSANSHKAGPTEKEIKTWPEWAQKLTDKVGLETLQKWHPTGWVNQNWLTHVIFYWLTHESPFADASERSFNTLVYWKFAIYIFGMICIYYTARLLGAHPYLAAVFSCFAMFIGRSLIDVRPAGFSNVLVAAFLLVLVLATYRNILYIWLLVPLTVFWCNLHGGYIYAFIMMVPFIGLHLFIALPKKWTVCFYSIAMWMGLYLFVFRFLNKLHGAAEDIIRQPEAFPAPSLINGIFYFIIFFILVSLILTSLRKVKAGVHYSYHIVITTILFFVFLVKLFPETPFALKVISSQDIKDRFQELMFTSQISYFLILLMMLVLGYILIYQKKKLVTIGVKGIWHSVAAGFVTFVAAILLNPFHLTNFTHTFIISVSKDAEMWRQVNEWHPAFAWTNPVGSAFPFLIMLILSIATFCYWLYCRYLDTKSEILKNELAKSTKTSSVLVKVFGWTSAMVLCWITFISFSFVKADLTSFLLCAAFTGIILLSVYKGVHFIYLSGLLILMALGISLLGAPEKPSARIFEGRYIFAFVLIPSYLIVHIVASLFSKHLRYKRKDILFLVLTAVITIILMFVIFKEPQPLRLKIDFGQSGWLGQIFLKLYDLRRTFKPLYEKNLDLSYIHLFKVLYVLNALSILIWLILPNLKVWFAKIKDKKAEINNVVDHPSNETAKIDLAYFIITALTIYMAVKSRRFMPIAGIAACSLIAVFITQIILTINSIINYNKLQRKLVSAIPYKLEFFLAIVGTCVVIFLGTFWAWKFRVVYLDPWPTDSEFTSVFMRMTASDRKPFHAGDFIRENNLQGKMFNYWTEGGFIGWCQNPDPNTGKTPLQLFMDGRAQAAYDPKTYRLWSKIMAGGPTAYDISLTGRKHTQSDYEEMGKYISEVLRKRKVWLILMPINKNTNHFIRSIETNNNWPSLFFNNKQRIYVDRESKIGRKLFEGIVTGDTVYPNEFSRNLMLARIYAKQKSIESKKLGLKMALEAFELLPSQVPMLEIVTYARYTELKPQVDDFCKKHIQDMKENINQYRNEDSYFNRITSTLLAIRYLEKAIGSKGDPQFVSLLANTKRAFESERRQTTKLKKW